MSRMDLHKFNGRTYPECNFIHIPENLLKNILTFWQYFVLYVSEYGISGTGNRKKANLKAVKMDCFKEISHYNIREAKPTPAKCALLVIDMQQYFQSIASPIIGNVISIVEACRSRNMRIIFTRHGHSDISKDGSMLYKWWGDFIQYGSKDWELIKAIQPGDYDAVLDKNRYSAFHGTTLDKSLQSIKIEELIITGVLTNCCCETTARDAFVRDYRVFFAGDATATANEELHLASLKNLAFGFAHILSTDQICDYLI